MTDAGESPVERVQCERFGRAALRRHLAVGRWVKVAPRVVVLHNGPLRPEQVLWVALLSAPRGSVLGSWSALAFEGLRTPRALPAHVVIPHRARDPVLSDVLEGTLVTRSSALAPLDARLDRSPPRTRPARSLIDAAILGQTPEQARLALIQGFQADITTADDLRAALEHRGQCRYLDLIREVIHDLEGGERSVPEHEFTLLLRRAGLPPPARQAVVQGPYGRYYLDADWPQFRVSAEVHGVHHAAIGQLERDWRRHNEITIDGGRRVLHFTGHQVRH